LAAAFFVVFVITGPVRQGQQRGQVLPCQTIPSTIREEDRRENTIREVRAKER